jgi:hypothetical protein
MYLMEHTVYEYVKAKGYMRFAGDLLRILLRVKSGRLAAWRSGTVDLMTDVVVREISNLHEILE